MGEETFPPIPADETQLYIFSLSQPLKPVVTPNCGTTFFCSLFESRLFIE